MKCGREFITGDCIHAYCSDCQKPEPFRLPQTELPKADLKQPSPDAGTGTPETDAATKYSAQIYPIENEKIEAVVRADFARSLETRLAAALADLELLEWQNKERLTVTWNHWHGAFIVQGQHQVCGNMGRGKTVIEALRAARAAKSEGGEDRKPA